MAHEQPAGEDPEMTSPTPATRRRFCDLVRKLVEGHGDPMMGLADEALRRQKREAPAFFYRSLDLGDGREMVIELDTRNSDNPRYEVKITGERTSPTGQKIIKDVLVVIEDGGGDNLIISERPKDTTEDTDEDAAKAVEEGYVGFILTEADLRGIIEKLESLIAQDQDGE